MLEPHRPMRTDAVFRIASMTKPVTSIAVLMLVDDGLVSLDEPLAAYVPGFVQPPVLESFDPRTGHYTTRPAARDATLRELLSHTGGYGYWFLDEPLRAASGDVPNLVDPPFLVADPGQTFSYSSSHDVAGRVVEAATGIPLGDFFDDRIFGPVGMTDTGFELPADPTRLVPISVRENGEFRQLPNEVDGHPARGGGGLYSTLADYLALLGCLLRGGAPLLEPATAAELGRNQIGELTAMPQKTAFSERTNDFIFMDGTQKYGLGVMVETHGRPGCRSAGSFGWAGILNTYFWVDPRADVAAVLLMQLKPFADPGCVEALGRFETAVYEDLSAAVLSASS